MSLLDALILGLVQGLTEFLPVSSSGHLVLGQRLLGIDPAGVTFEVILHLATLLAVVWVYRARVLELLGGLFRGRSEAWRYAGLIVLASIPAGVAGILARTWFEEAFDHPVIAAAMLVVTGVFVYSLRYAGSRAERPALRPGDAVLVGIAQALAILPGISRSGATVAMGAWRGVEVVRMAEFSFLMSIPVILGAGLLQLRDVGAAAPVSGPVLLVGGTTAAIAGIGAIRLFVHMLRGRTFHRFAWYCWIVGGAYLTAAAVWPALR